MGGRGGANRAYERYVAVGEQARRVRALAGRVASTPSRELEQVDEAVLDRLEDALIAVTDGLELQAGDRRKATG
jgi:predicted DNA-binding protein